MDKILVGITKDNKEKCIELVMANRHGLIAGATGTGKTVTLQTIAEQFSDAGIAIFLADVKGDLSGLSAPGNNSKIFEIRKELTGHSAVGRSFPTVFWDIYGQAGQPLRATISEIGPLLLGRFLEANKTQQGIINAAFSFADDEGLLLLDLKDFRSLLDWMGDNADSLRDKYGNISKTSIGAIQRGLLTLQEAGGDKFFGEPALKLADFMQKTEEGKGYISILDATKLINDPTLYSTFLLWLLSELFEQLPEVGDVKIPKLVFFFDEAHLLFNTCPKILLDKLEQMVRLIRSKGVGVYFVTQNPLDIPETILGQLGNRIQHGLRAFTPKDQKAVKVAAQTFRQNPKLDTETVITELGVGEALVSFLDDKGIPSIVEKVKVIPPLSRIGSINSQERTAVMSESPSAGIYDNPVDRESAYEIIARKTIRAQQPALEKPYSPPRTQRPRMTQPDKTQTILKGTIKVLNSRVGQKIVRGILGSIFGGKK